MSKFETVEEMLARLAAQSRRAMPVQGDGANDAVIHRREALQAEIRGLEAWLRGADVPPERWRWPLVSSRTGRRYPRLKYTAEQPEDVAELCIIAESGCGPDYTVEVVGHPAWGSYEWVAWKGDELVAHSNDGYGRVGVCLRDGLLHLEPLQRRDLERMTAVLDEEDRQWQAERERKRIAELRAAAQEHPRPPGVPQSAANRYPPPVPTRRAAV